MLSSQSRLPLAYMHVPKTAGTSFTRGLIKSLRPRHCVGGFDRALFGGFNDFHELSPSSMRYIYLKPDEIPPKTDLLAGHFSLSTIDARMPSARRMTIMREPFSRLLSHWIFWRSGAARSEDRNDWERRLSSAHAPLLDFLNEPQVSCQTDNVFARMLLWPDVPTDEFFDEADDDRILALCLERLQRFEFVGLVEDPKIWGKLGAWVGKRVVPLREKVTSPVPEQHRGVLAEYMSAAAVDALRWRSRIDNRLWREIGKRAAPELDLATVRARSIEVTVARSSALLSGGNGKASAVVSEKPAGREAVQSRAGAKDYAFTAMLRRPIRLGASSALARLVKHAASGAHHPVRQAQEVARVRMRFLPLRAGWILRLVRSRYRSRRSTP